MRVPQFKPELEEALAKQIKMVQTARLAQRLGDLDSYAIICDEIESHANKLIKLLDPK